MFRRAVIPLVVLLAALPACARADAPAAPPPASMSAADRFLRLYRGYRSEFNPAASPAALAALSDVVLLGRLKEIREGSIRGASRDDPDRTEHLVFRFAVVELPKGTAPGGIVWVEDTKPRAASIAEFRASLPLGTPAVLYLTQAPQPDAATLPAPNPPPRDAPLTRLTNPQGFLIFLDGRVLSPLASKSRPLFADADPDSTDPRGWLPPPGIPS